MEELQYIYISIKERILEYESRGYSNQEIETEIRLDIENCLDLIASELSIELEKDKED